jgi:outer membrane protein assembly factor BamB
LWRTDLPAEIKASPVVADDQGLVAIATVAGVCHLLDLTDGKLQTSIPLRDKVTASGALQQGLLVLGLATGRVVCIDLSRGEITWEATHGGPRSYTSFTLNPSGDFIATSKDGNIICRNAMTGKFLWESTQVMGLPDHEPSMDITPVASSTGRMYCASYNGDLYEFSFQRYRSTQE